MIVFAVLALASGTALYLRDGSDALLGRTTEAVALLLRIAPLIAGGLLIAEFAKILLPEARMRRLIGGESGWRGLALSSVAGALTPGGPFTAFPLVLAFQRAGADAGATVAYVTAWSLLGWQRIFVFELPLMGPEFVWVRVVVSLPMSFLAGWLARLLVRRGLLAAC